MWFLILKNMRQKTEYYKKTEPVEHSLDCSSTMKPQQCFKGLLWLLVSTLFTPPDNTRGDVRGDRLRHQRKPGQVMCRTRVRLYRLGLSLPSSSWTSRPERQKYVNNHLFINAFRLTWKPFQRTVCSLSRSKSL